MTRIPFCLLAALLVGCSSQQQTFKSPDAAADSLASALRAGDTSRLDKIFGKEGAAIVSSGDPVADKGDFAKFVEAYDAKHELSPAADGEMTLTIGKDDWPFPVPITQSDKGWMFDTAAGKDEILNRRIGRNELSTIEVCCAVVDAQREYARLDPGGVGLPVYARRIISEPGKKNGLYWPTAAGEPPSPLGPLVAEAADEGYTAKGKAKGESAPYHGYRYRLLTAQGPNAPGGAMDYVVGGHLLSGFGLIAYPAEYGNSGVMTFMINHQGELFQKDLGDKTHDVARSINTFDPGEGWTKCEKPQE